MINILNIETATDICSIAISANGKQLSLAESTEAYQHAAQITLLIDKCLQQSGLSMSHIDGVAVSSGPGSYTALRVGTSVAKGICYALDKPLVVVDTLEALAGEAARHEGRPNTLYCPMIDARRMEVYTAVFDHNLKCIQPVASLILMEDSFKSQLENGFRVVCCGNGARKITNVLHHERIKIMVTQNSASYMVKIAHERFEHQLFENLARYSPNYFKNPYITTPKKIL